MGVALWTAESEALSVAAAPADGARIVSLCDPRSGEWLAQPRSPRRPHAPGDPFVRPDIGGWDEMVNTIVACASPLDGAPLVDHGDAWASAWQVVDATARSLTTEYRSPGVPIRVQRTLALEGGGLALDYHVANDADQPVPVFWSAHPLFDTTAVDRVELGPPAARDLRLVTPDPGDGCGSLLPADLAPGASAKYWVAPGDAPVASVSLDRGGSRLTLAWDAGDVPYFGVFVDNDEYGPGPVLSPQPSLAYYDSAERAHALGHLPWIDPGSHLRWRLTVTI